MAGEEAAEGSRSRRRMDLNLYLGLPPLPWPPGRLDTTLDCLVSVPNSAGPAPRMDQPEELLTQVAAYSPSNALSTPEEQSMMDPLVYAWLDGQSTDGEDGTDAVGSAEVLSAPVDGANVSPLPAALAAGLEEDDFPQWVERFVHSGQVTDGVEMVSTTSIRNRSVQGALDIEARTPELRFQRLIQISQQHSIVTSSANRSQRASSPDVDRLVWAIQRSHNSLDTANRQNMDGDGKVGGNGAIKKDGCCDCNSNFDCNICLDSAKEPVVTLCGHLFCWPCLYHWLHAASAHSECPVCKGEVFEVNVTPIYGRGGHEQGSSSLDMPPRPRANRMESLRQQLQMADSRGIASAVRQLIGNHDIVRGQSNPAGGVEVPVVPASRSRARARRQQRQDSISAIMQNMGNVVPDGRNQVPLPPTTGDNTAPVVPAAPQQSSSVEQPSTSSTVAVIMGEPGSSGRSRPSETATTRRTRRRQQGVP